MTDVASCLVCERETSGYLCMRCQARLRDDITRVVALTKRLGDAVRYWPSGGLDPTGVRSAERPTPGGDALVMIAPGNAAGWHHDLGMELPDDPQPPRAVLEGWAEYVRDCREHDIPEWLTIGDVADYLARQLDWVSEELPEAGDMARDLRRLRGRLESIIGDVTWPQRGIPCPECGAPLMRHYGQPDPCPPGCAHEGHGHDQGGLRDEWRCARQKCSEVVEAHRYHLLVWQAWLDQRGEAA